MRLPTQADWGIDDPADAIGSEADVLVEFEIAYGHMKRRIDAFLALPIETMGGADIKTHMSAIGEISD